jgi:plasmid stabilization system protein ParE
MDVVVTIRARAEITAAVAYRAERNATAAQALLDHFTRRFNELGHFPMMGRSRGDIRPAMRAILVENYIAFYYLGTEKIFVVRVLDSRMNVEQQFDR